MKMTNVSLVLLLLSTMTVANAGTVQTLNTKNKIGITDPYFQIKNVKITELTAEEALEYANTDADKDFTGPKVPNVPPIPPAGGGSTPTPAPRGALDSIIMVVDKLVAIGQKIIPTIKEGKPVVTNNPMTAVSVLPRGEGKDLVVHDMGGWTIPVSKHYKIVYSNGFGADVVSFVYSISYQYNGNVDGKGKYLAGIRASARDIRVDWGFDLDASSQLIQISNVGTQKDVIAGATIEMSYTVKNWTRTLTTNTSFHVTGDGKLYRLD